MNNRLLVITIYFKSSILVKTTNFVLLLQHRVCHLFIFVKTTNLMSVVFN